jgi:hypothetical protein
MMASRIANGQDKQESAYHQAKTDKSHLAHNNCIFLPVSYCYYSTGMVDLYSDKQG